MAAEKKQTLTPKEIIHQMFGDQAIYTIEEDHVSCQNSCLYRCNLQLPDFSVETDVFKKKKDSEQTAAELALEKLGIQPQDYDEDITVEQALDDIAKRIKCIFSDEFLSAGHPLGSHLRATLQRDGGSVPVSAIATFDATINSLCKVVDQDPILAMSYVMKAAEKLPDDIVVSPHVVSLRRKNPYPPAIIQGLATHVEKSIKVEAVYIQCTSSGEEVVDSITLDISPGRYYLDIIAEKLGLKDSSQLIISRTFSKTSECRVYSAIPKLNPCDKSSSKAYGKLPIDENQSSHMKKPWNAKASYVCCQDIHGDAIVAAVGYTWRSHDLEHDDVTLKSFYRICCGMSPNGIYKISREALIAAKLPFSFTTKSNWRGSLPRDLLCKFCRQQQLSEPVFTITSAPVKPLSEILGSFQKLQDSEWSDSSSECETWEMDDSESDDSNNQHMRINEEDSRLDDTFNLYMRINEEDSRPVDQYMSSRGKEEEVPVLGSGYRCEVKILSKSQDLVLDCSLRNLYKKENDAVQNASLKALTWFSSLFDDLDADPDKPRYTNEDLNRLFKFMTKRTFRVQTIPNGYLVAISYSVSVVVDPDLKQVIESNEKIEFEVGNGSMNPHLESVVTQMYVGQSACFRTNLPAQGLVLAAANDTVRTRSLLSEVTAGLEYSVYLLGVKGPTEKQMETAFFKPPLSEQRIDYAVKHIKESSASTLVDFGCGSASLLDSLLDHPTSLQDMFGVDNSQKALARAVKKLDTKLKKGAWIWNLKYIKLYDGSILQYDSKLHDIDIGICLEVIEHMKEDEAFQFGETVLSLFRPKVLIVSTPNYEYNTILYKSALYLPKDRSMSQFRNHDHKFEWTREQFNQWATKLAERQNYSVEFSGVGGSGEVEPGFASQIAVFKREASAVENVAEGLMQPYKVIWEWKKGNGEKGKKD